MKPGLHELQEEAHSSSDADRSGGKRDPPHVVRVSMYDGAGVLKLDYRALEDLMSPRHLPLFPMRGRRGGNLPFRLIIWHEIGGCS